MTKRIVVKGAVQGIGYRPFIYEKATEYGLSGYVKNCGAWVEIIVSGKEALVLSFLDMLPKEVPPGGFVLSVEEKDMDENEDVLSSFHGKFTIVDSNVLDLSTELSVFLPDIGICDNCMEEMLAPGNRRYRYPLISCAVCGPRMSILNKLPYDRNTTTMEDFEMCPNCRKDYGIGRRKYAQTISCHNCGPQMILRINVSKPGEEEKHAGQRLIDGEAALQEAVKILRDGGIIGLKGISGYQLVCRPDDESAKRIRRIKGRENKPFAIMFSTAGEVRKYAYLSGKEEELIRSSARPIVLVERKDHESSQEEVFRGSRYIGAFLPSAGVHRLLTDELGPLIVTSANKSDQPMIIDDDEFLKVFMDDGDSIDGVLYHLRRINMAQDDSVMFVTDIGGREYSQFIRRARGFAPLPILLDDRNNFESGVLAMGGDLKSCFALGKGSRIIPSQYIGDLEDYTTYNSYNKLLSDYQRIFEFKPDIVVKDLHPDYFSSKIAKKVSEDADITFIGLQHHFAHIYSVMAENSLESAIGAAFDGTGYGLDGNIWGGEFIYCKGTCPIRLGHLSYAKLAGGNTAPKNAGNVALCYIHECEKRALLTEGHLKKIYEKGYLDNLGKEPLQSEKLLYAALDNNVGTFETSSMGRLFDAVSAVIGICSYNSYEGEAAIMLEKAAWEFAGKTRSEHRAHYPRFEFSINEEYDCFTANQISLLAEIVKCHADGCYDIGAIAYGFHIAISDLIVRGCRIMKEKTLENKVCLSGGVFNNRLILKSSIEALLKEGFEVYWNRKVPSGDGGISTGQAYYGLLGGK